ncbi:hypothetical protein B0J13DRAFT_566146 [Dactylonectria estremocensis]|uniref:Uncharacterized protein n=1 Tax=Dactylonectria estremocensis TaxID=1079267 RepID=A0A9P9DU28_9HYPO|nr:hypothetical protein B0J13DRAFT_566146 [Dactylonectria estremocensis]
MSSSLAAMSRRTSIPQQVRLKLALIPIVFAATLKSLRNLTLSQRNSMSDSSGRVERLDANNPLFPVLTNVLFRLLCGYRTREQYPSSTQSGQGVSMSTPNLSNNRSRMRHRA